MMSQSEKAKKGWITRKKLYGNSGMKDIEKFSNNVSERFKKYYKEGKMISFFKGKEPWNKGLKGLNIGWQKGKSRPKEYCKQISLRQTGKKLSEKTKRKISVSHKGKIFSEIHKKRLSEKAIIRQNILWQNIEYRKQMRKSAIKYVNEVRSDIIPRLGRYEKQILDEVENFIELKIIRQFPVLGYWVDGYLPKANIVFEVDERPKIKEKDILRENIIKNELNCNFIRIPTYV